MFPRPTTTISITAALYYGCAIADADGISNTSTINDVIGQDIVMLNLVITMQSVVVVVMMMMMIMLMLMLMLMLMRRRGRRR